MLLLTAGSALLNTRAAACIDSAAPTLLAIVGMLLLAGSVLLKTRAAT
jgi:hypothetical protein